MFDNLKFNPDRSAYLQLSEYIKDLIVAGALRQEDRLPSTRELSEITGASRNTIINAYKQLEEEGLIRSIKGQGTYVNAIPIRKVQQICLNWPDLISHYSKVALTEFQTAKEFPWQNGFISFNSLAPDDSIIEVEEVKRAFLNRISLEGEKLLNYGQSKGYRQLLDWIRKYLGVKGVDFSGKDILITNGFTESFNLVLTALTGPGDQVLCENPTHNLALSIMKLAGLAITGVNMGEDGMNLVELEQHLANGGFKLGFVMPSYHNPTGLVMTPEKRLRVLELFNQFQVPLIEEGFNEELRYSGSHCSPLIAMAGLSNNLIYLGSFSKILFPGIRAGWIVADASLINYLESIKFYRNIYTSLLDQAVLYEYLQNGKFQQYLKKLKRIYKEKYELAVKLVETEIPCRRLFGDGGLHLFIELNDINSRELLARCYQRKVLFTPGTIFYTDESGENTLRLSISRIDRGEIEKGITIIGEEVRSFHHQR